MESMAGSADVRATTASPTLVLRVVAEEASRAEEDPSAAAVLQEVGNVRHRFTSDERRRIDEAIASVERSTTADLDLMVLRASDRYPLYPLVWAGGCALLIGGISALLRSAFNGRAIILIELVVLIALTLLLDWLPLRLMLVPARVKRARARQLAHRQFDAHLASGEPHRKRILFFVSLGEHYVEIIADHDTHSRMPVAVWNKVLEDFVTAVKAGRVADSLIVAIESCGTLLRTHYPGPAT
jgi:putative membrane protein